MTSEFIEVASKILQQRANRSPANNICVDGADKVGRRMFDAVCAKSDMIGASITVNLPTGEKAQRKVNDNFKFSFHFSTRFLFSSSNL